MTEEEWLAGMSDRDFEVWSQLMAGWAGDGAPTAPGDLIGAGGVVEWDDDVGNTDGDDGNDEIDGDDDGKTGGDNVDPLRLRWHRSSRVALAQHPS